MCTCTSPGCLHPGFASRPGCRCTPMRARGRQRPSRAARRKQTCNASRARRSSGRHTRRVRALRNLAEGLRAWGAGGLQAYQEGACACQPGWRVGRGFAAAALSSAALAACRTRRSRCRQAAVSTCSTSFAVRFQLSADLGGDAALIGSEAAAEKQAGKRKRGKDAAGEGKHRRVGRGASWSVCAACCFACVMCCLRTKGSICYSYLNPPSAEPSKKRGRKKTGDAAQAAADTPAATAAGASGKSSGAGAGEREEEPVLWRVNYDEFNRRWVPVLLSWWQLQGFPA